MPSRKAIIPLILSAFLCLAVIQPTNTSAVEVIDRTATPVHDPNSAVDMSPLQGVLDMLSSVWLPILICIAVAIGLLLIWKWWNTKKEQSNIFLRDYNRTVLLCQLGSNPKRIKKRAFWLYLLTGGSFCSMLLLVVALVLDDVPSFQLSIGLFAATFVGSLVLKFAGFFTCYDVLQIIGKFGVKAIGNYLGECTSSDGYKNYMLWSTRKYVFWKNKFILKVNLNDKVRFEIYDQETKKRSIITHELPKDLILEGDSVIAVKGEGVDKAGYYYYPVLADKEGNIINMDLIAYTRSKEVALLDTLYQQTEDFSKVQRQAINMNPNVRYVMKTRGDTITGAEESSQQ